MNVCTSPSLTCALIPVISGLSKLLVKHEYPQFSAAFNQWHFATCALSSHFSAMSRLFLLDASSRYGGQLNGYGKMPLVDALWHFAMMRKKS